MSRVPASLPWRPVSCRHGQGQWRIVPAPPCAASLCSCGVPRVRGGPVVAPAGIVACPRCLVQAPADAQNSWQETLVGSLLAAGEFFEVCSAFCDVFGAQSGDPGGRKGRGEGWSILVVPYNVLSHVCVSLAPQDLSPEDPESG